MIIRMVAQLIDVETLGKEQVQSKVQFEQNMLLSNRAIGSIVPKLLPRGSEMQVVCTEVTVKVMRRDKISHE